VDWGKRTSPFSPLRPRRVERCARGEDGRDFLDAGGAQFGIVLQNYGVFGGVVGVKSTDHCVVEVKKHDGIVVEVFTYKSYPWCAVING
jgi:hypothetical protein